MMMPPTPARRIHPRALLGFREGTQGTHASRTIMMEELDILLSHAAIHASNTDYQHLIVEENILGKLTLSNRIKAWQHLRNLYGLNPKLPIFRVFRQLWTEDAPARPLLAILCACANDPLLRSVAPMVLAIPQGETFEVTDLELAFKDTIARFTPPTQRAFTQRIASSFAQSGHLSKTRHKQRIRVPPSPAATTFAIYLGYMEGQRGLLLLDTFWTHLLDTPHATMIAQLHTAALQGWIDLYHAAGMLDIRLHLLTPQEKELCDGLQS